MRLIRELDCGARGRGYLTSRLLLKMTIWVISFELGTLIYPLVVDLGRLFDSYLSRQRVGSGANAYLLAISESE